MKAKNYATIINGKIANTIDSSREEELFDNQIPLTWKELCIIRIIDGDLEYGRNILRDVEERIQKKVIELEARLKA